MSSATTWDTIITQIETRIAEVTASANPDYSVAGRSISKGAYLAQLMAAYKDALINRQRAEGPFEIKSLGI